MRNLAVRGIYVSLALLTFFAVFVGTVGAREALASRTQAIRQTIAANPALSRTITVNSTLHDVQGALASESLYGPPPTVTPSTISAIGGQLHHDFDRGSVTLSPVSGDLSLMTTGLNLLPSTLPGTGGTSAPLPTTTTCTSSPIAWPPPRARALATALASSAGRSPRVRITQDSFTPAPGPSGQAPRGDDGD